MKATCPKCAGAFEAAEAGGLCPACLADMIVSPTGEPVQETPLSRGDTFHGLEVVALVGRGGMGVVYKARQPQLDRFVALKILPRRLAADEEFRRRFVREAKALAALSHPNIVAVHDFGIERDLVFLVMEFVDGVNLRQVLRDQKLRPEEALRIVPQLCDGLEFAHKAGVVHRDIKPENILIDRQGRVKIADFGLAKLVGEPGGTLTRSDVAMGTPRYMAPEQLEDPKSVDHRADIYSMGVVFYEMLTGQVPMGHFLPPSNKVRIDVRLDEVVLKALAREPERRYQRADDVKSDVTRIGATAGSQPRSSDETRLKLARWSFYTLLGAAGAGILAFWIWMSPDLREYPLIQSLSPLFCIFACALLLASFVLGRVALGRSASLGRPLEGWPRIQATFAPALVSIGLLNSLLCSVPLVFAVWATKNGGVGNAIALGLMVFIAVWSICGLTTRWAPIAMQAIFRPVFDWIPVKAAQVIFFLGAGLAAATWFTAIFFWRSQR